MIETVIRADAGPLRFCSVHFDHIGPQTRLPQVHHAMDLLLNASHRGSAWGGKIAGDWYEIPPPPVPERTIVMGDFNFTPDSEGICAFDRRPLGEAWPPRAGWRVYRCMGGRR